MADTDAEVKFGADLEDVKKSLQEINDYMHGWGAQIKDAFMDGVVAVITGGFSLLFDTIRVGITSVMDFFKESLDAGTERELNFTRLELTLDHVKGGFALSAQQIRDWADGIESATGVADDQIEKVAASLARFHIGGDTFRQAVKAALDISAETGSSFEGTASKIGRALSGLEQGQAFGIRRLREELADLSQAEKTHIEDLAKSGKGHEAVGLVVEELNRKYGGAAEVIGNTLHGQLQRLHAILGNVYENIGDKLVPIVKDFTPLFIELAHEVEHVSVIFADWIGDMAKGESAQGFVKGLKSTIETVFFTIKEGLERAPTYIEKVYHQIMSSILGIKKELLEIISAMPKFLVGDIDDPRSAAGKAAKGANAAAFAAEDEALLAIKSQKALTAMGTIAEDVAKDIEALTGAEAKRTEKLKEQEEQLKRSAEAEADRNANRKLTDDLADQLNPFGSGEFVKEKADPWSTVADPLEELNKKFDKDTAKLNLEDQMDVLRQAIDEDEKSKKDKQPFQSAIEQGTSVFNRIQTAAASDPHIEVAKSQLKVQLEALQHQKDAEAKAEARQKPMDEYLAAIAKQTAAMEAHAGA